MNEATYVDVLKFYLGKSSKCSDELFKYINQSGQNKSGYIELAKSFNNEMNAGNTKYEDLGADRQYFKKLVDITVEEINKNYNNGLNPQMLNEIKNLGLKYEKDLPSKPCKERSEKQKELAEEVKFDQKWHLIISFIMYELVFALQDEKCTWFESSTKRSNLGDTFDYYKGGLCPELMLWMIEASGVAGNLDNLNKSYIDLINEVEEMKNNNKYNSTICAEIRKKYPWEKIEEIIAPIPKQEENQ